MEKTLSVLKSDRTKEKFVLIVCILLVMLFGYTALSKLLAFDHFVFQLGLNPMPLIYENKSLIAWGVPLIELSISTIMIWESTRYIGLLASASLLIIFETYILAMLVSGLDLPCSCGGVIALMSWKTHLVFNAVFILLTLLAITVKRKN